MRSSLQIGNYGFRSRRFTSRSSLQQPNPTFFGLDQNREKQLKQFFSQPIDSRAPFEDVPDVKYVHKIPNHVNEPSPEIQNEWDLRMQRIRKRKEEDGSFTVMYPSLPRREEIKEIISLNPLNIFQVEDVQNINNIKVYGPMNKISAMELPEHRYISNVFRQGKCNLKKRKV
ncbi:hypothetical protein M9Y10_017414 [Tritrichomonas musculus]|uniref:Uncharacterized protein n=1 Tax=Tritrichomonas musculus TaxID=1915356 RepID=A0ABR2HTJ5_9EUKA